MATSSSSKSEAGKCKQDEFYAMDDRSQFSPLRNLVPITQERTESIIRGYVANLFVSIAQITDPVSIIFEFLGTFVSNAFSLGASRLKTREISEVSSNSLSSRCYSGKRTSDRVRELALPIRSKKYTEEEREKVLSEGKKNSRFYFVDPSDPLNIAQHISIQSRSSYDEVDSSKRTMRWVDASENLFPNKLPEALDNFETSEILTEYQKEDVRKLKAGIDASNRESYLLIDEDGFYSIGSGSTEIGRPFIVYNSSSDGNFIERPFADADPSMRNQEQRNQEQRNQEQRNQENSRVNLNLVAFRSEDEIAFGQAIDFVGPDD